MDWLYSGFRIDRNPRKALPDDRCVCCGASLQDLTYILVDDYYGRPQMLHACKTCWEAEKEKLARHSKKIKEERDEDDRIREEEERREREWAERVWAEKQANRKPWETYNE